MHADTMGYGRLGHLYLAVQHAAFFKMQMGDILVVTVQDWKARQDGIPMVAVVVDHIAAIGGILPGFLGQKFVLGDARPVVMIARVTEMQTLHFLEKYDVRIQFTQTLTQFVDHHLAIELRKSFMDVVGGDV